MRNGRLRIEALEERRLLAVVMVDTEVDSIDFNDGKTSLREAIFATNLVPGADTIEFASSLAGKTILLKQGELAINDALTINGLGQNLLTIDASGNDSTPEEDNGDGSRVFSIFNTSFYEPWPDGYKVALSDLTLTGGDAEGPGGAILSGQNVCLERVDVVKNSSLSDGGGIYVRTSGDAVHIEINNSVIAFNRSDNTWSYGGGIAIDAYNSDGNVKIRGSSIHNNHAMGTWAWGGGISILGGGCVELAGNQIYENRATGDWSWGGGLHVKGTSAAEIICNAITNNSANAGGGAAVEADRGTVLVRTNAIESNVARYGGGMYVAGSLAKINVEENWISRNETHGIAANGGGLFFDIQEQCEVTLSTNLITGNSSAGMGGGLYVENDNWGGSFISKYDSVLQNTSVGSGGGVCIQNGENPTGFLNTTIAGNTNVDWGGGGGLCVSGNIIIQQSTISKNRSVGVGGGISCAWSNATIVNSTITGNTALTAGGLYCLNELSLVGCIVADNRADDQSSDIYQPQGSLELTYSLLGNNNGLDWDETPIGSPDANGNLIGGAVHGVIDPLLGPLQDNGGITLTHALLLGSPAINAGDPSFTGPPDYDQRGVGFDRVVDGRVDIGAFEVRTAPIPGDFDADGDVDGRDFLAWQRNPSVGRLSDWREQYGAGEPLAVSSQLLASEELRVESLEPDSDADPGNAIPGLGAVVMERLAIESDRGYGETVIDDSYVENVDRGGVAGCDAAVWGAGIWGDGRAAVREAGSHRSLTFPARRKTRGLIRGAGLFATPAHSY